MSSSFHPFCMDPERRRRTQFMILWPQHVPWKVAPEWWRSDVNWLGFIHSPHHRIWIHIPVRIQQSIHSWDLPHSHYDRCMRNTQRQRNLEAIKSSRRWGTWGKIAWFWTWCKLIFQEGPSSVSDRMVQARAFILTVRYLFEKNLAKTFVVLAIPSLELTCTNMYQCPGISSYKERESKSIFVRLAATFLVNSKNTGKYIPVILVFLCFWVTFDERDQRESICEMRQCKIRIKMRRQQCEIKGIQQFNTDIAHLFCVSSFAPMTWCGRLQTLRVDTALWTST